MGKKQQGHRQRGAGTVTVSKGEQLRQGVMCKEWQRTPIQLLHEYCQSKKREKPIYSRVRAPDGRFRMRCILPDGKNSSKDVTFSTEQDFETMDEAKHCSALLALKHVEPLRPYEQKLPDPYRDLWLALDNKSDGNSSTTTTFTTASSSNSKKKESKTSTATVKGKKGQDTIPPPPAAAVAVHDQDDNMDLWQSTADDQDEDDTEQDKKKNKFPIELTADRKFASKAEFMQAQLQRQQSKNKKLRQRENRERANMLKQVFMSTECREKIEQILKQLGTIQGIIPSSVDTDNNNPKMIDGHEEFYHKVSDKLRSIGFLPSHVQGAIQSCKRQPNHTSEEYMTMILDWLCLHVPEEELPKEFNPQGTQMDAIIHQKNSITNDQLNISLSFGTKLIQRLMKYGYDRLDAIQSINEYFEKAQLKEDQAKLLPIEELTWKLVEILFKRLLAHHIELVTNPTAATQSLEEEQIQLHRQDEIFALEAIYMDTMKQKTLLNGDLILQVPASEHVMLEIYLPKNSNYPFELPMIAVHVAEEEELPHLQALLQATKEALKSCVNSIGEPMIYDLCVSVDTHLRQASKDQAKDKIILYPKEAKISEDLVKPTVDKTSVPAPPPPPTASTKPTKAKSSKRKHGLGSSGASPAKIQALSDMLLNQHKTKIDTKAYQDMQSKRNTLPAAAEKDHILQLLHSNQVLLIAGQTGCGKTTQLPQFILDEYIQKGQGGACQIICTQPRRIAAIGVATRVAEERCEQVSDVVGYQIRMEAKRSASTRLLFCTTGVLLRRLLNDRSLEGVTHVIVDEVHERNVDTDFLLSVLRDLLPQRPDLRLILMSATMNAELFVNYFTPKNVTVKCPVLEIPGFTYPVESFYLEDIVKQTQYRIPRHMLKKKSTKDQENKEGATAEKDVEEELVTRFDDSRIDYDLFVHMITYLIEQQEQKSQKLGSILVFLPGTAEIKRLIEALTQSKEISSKIWALPLHGSLSAADQAIVFRNAPKGKYKIIVSTNIAETSITINDVTAVLDCGKLKEMVYDSTNRRSQLLDTWASKAACDQRKGRAGRVQAGQCYRLFTKKRWSNLASQLAAEIHRVSLEQLCLQIKKLELGPIRKFLSKAIEPPQQQAVDSAIQGLLDIGAFTRQQKGQNEVSLTPLGSHLAMLPMDARLGKFLVFGSILRCVEPVAMIASCISNRSPFMMTSDPEIRAKQEQTKKDMAIGHSDHLLKWKLMETYDEQRGQKNKRAFCKEKGVSYEAMETIVDLKDQYLIQLETIGFYETKSVDNHWNENAKTPRIIKAALCAGLFANVIQVWYPEQKYFQSAHGVFTEQHEAKKISYWIRSASCSSDDQDRPSQTRERVFLHPSSCNFQANQYDSPWLLYSDLVQTSKLFVRDSTMIHPYALLLFGDQLQVVHEKGELHLLEGWIRFKAVARIGVLIKSIRQHLDQLLLEKIETPQLDIAQSELITAIGYLLTSEGM